MKILYVVPYVPNLIRVRPYQLIRHLHKRGHTLTVATLWSSDDEGDLEALRAMGPRVVGAPHGRQAALLNCLAALPTRTPLQAAWCRSAALDGQLEAALLDGPDAVHVEHLRGSPALLHLRGAIDALPPAQRPRLVWDSVDCISLLFEQAARASQRRSARWLARFEVGRTRDFEAGLLRVADHTVVTAEGDAAALRALAQQSGHAAPPLSVVPNGVDTEAFRSDPSVARAPARVVYSGKMSYHANETAALQLARAIMPLVWAERPDAELWIVGKDPGPELTALHAPQAEQRRVVVTGAVDSMARALQESTVAAAPVPYGAGVQNKVLEAMACGTPVVASRQAASALEATPGADLMIADGAAGFAEQILALLASPALRAQVGEAGRAYVERCHSWDKSAALLEGIYSGGG